MMGTADLRLSKQGKSTRLACPASSRRSETESAQKSQCTSPSISTPWTQHVRPLFPPFFLQTSPAFPPTIIEPTLTITLLVAPATGTPETGGWSTRELRTIIRGLEGINFVAADIVEVAPAYDTNAEHTTMAAADTLFEVMSLMVKRGPMNVMGKGEARGDGEENSVRGKKGEL